MKENVAIIKFVLALVGAIIGVGTLVFLGMQVGFH